ncbi:Kiwa anti-phage protein KwaB-like domain-containing protein [Mesorhizobium sp. M1252]|uniref:Kiwa anti-phage protein KwaB-like domain-containing protein n=1 Tax=Mesorhizobium sp. M1252 TaxID=2957073 RepID=UPI0033358072
MPVNLLALCKQPGGLSVRRIRVSADVQNQLDGIFIQQEQAFYEGVTEEVQFDGGWKPEANELLYAPVTPEAAAVFEAAQVNLVAMPEVNPAAFSEANIRGLAVVVEREGAPRLLIQGFSAAQILDRRFSLILDGNTFNRLTHAAFSIGSQLVASIENGRIKFKNFSRIKLLFDLTNLYQEATDAELDTFCDLPVLQIDNVVHFKHVADQRMRKLIHAIESRGTLQNYTPQQIATAAIEEGFTVAIVNDRIVMPHAKAEAKALLHFLDNGLYRAALTGEIFITNSKRLHSGAVPLQAA